MAAAAGANEGSPQEPMNPALAQTAPAEGDLLEAGPPQAGAAELESDEAEVARDEPVETAEDEPAGTVASDAVHTDAGSPEAELADAGAAGNESNLTEPDAEQASLEQADAERARDMSPLAIIGVIVVVIALVGVAAGVLSVVTHGFHRKTVVSYKPAAVFTLKPGDCVDSSGSGLTFTLLACSKSHSSEVFATFALTGSDWPGVSAVQTDAANGCADRLASYLNPNLANAGLAQEYIYPDESAWKAGEHTVVCEVRSSTGQITGSVRKAS
jgi:Septum formation